MKDGKITNDNRIQAALPTINKLVENGAKIVLCSHLGKPKNGPEEKFSLAPVAVRLSELLGQDVVFANDDEVVGENAKKAVAEMKDGDVVLLQNTRFRKEETKNLEPFSSELASLADVFVMDAFGSAHRAHCSTVGVTDHIKDTAVGYLMQKEIDYLGNAVETPVRPFVAILGGAKVADKLNVISNLLEKCDTLIIGGGMAYTFLKAQGKEVGLSLVDDTKIDYCKEMMAKAEKLGKKLLLPIDTTVAAGFPTTITPAIQYGAVPVFVDVTIPQYNIDVTKLEDALSDKTKAVMIAHTLGNPFDLSAVKAFCDKHNLWLVEDNCDALGSKYTINGEEKFTGTIGDIGTSSFYPPHHMTMGEGGAVYTNNALLNKCIRSFRDWGRDCVCPSGRDNLCGHRFDKQYGELPLGYDHKYVYSHFGYNLKATDMQAAVGCAQLEKFPSFVERRRHNFDRLRAALADIEDKVILPVPCENSRPSWFGFLITVKEGIDRKAVVEYIESHGVQTRNLFAGNLIKHPCFDEMRATGEGYRVVGGLDTTDRIMRDTFWVGVYPGMTDEMIDYMAKTIKEAVNQ